MTTVVFVDTETTRLDDDGEVWEIGAIVREPDHPDVRHRYLIYPQRRHIAEPQALAIGRFHERTDHITTHLRGIVANLAEPGVAEAWSDPSALAVLLEEMFDGAVLVGSNAQFDHRKLAFLLTRFGRELRRPLPTGRQRRRLLGLPPRPRCCRPRHPAAARRPGPRAALELHRRRHGARRPPAEPSRGPARRRVRPRRSRPGHRLGAQRMTAGALLALTGQPIAGLFDEEGKFRIGSQGGEP